MKPLKRRSLLSWCPWVSVTVAVVCLGFFGHELFKCTLKRDVTIICYHFLPVVTPKSGEGVTVKVGVYQ